MNVQCPSCSTTFRVDPAKVPTGGVRARCSVCAAVFPVSVTSGGGCPGRIGAADPHGAPPPPPPPRPAARTDPARRPRPNRRRRRCVTRRRRQRPLPTPVDSAAHAGGVDHPASDSGGRGRRSPSRRDTPLPQPMRRPRDPPPAGAPVNPFLSQDPALKARRLARALVSDMVVYHPAKRRDALKAGHHQGFVQGRDHQELGGVRRAGRSRACRLHSVLPGSAQRDPGRRQPDLLDGNGNSVTRN